jgi:hypothetical protein
MIDDKRSFSFLRIPASYVTSPTREVFLQTTHLVVPHRYGELSRNRYLPNVFNHVMEPLLMQPSKFKLQYLFTRRSRRSSGQYDESVVRQSLNTRVLGNVLGREAHEIGLIGPTGARTCHGLDDSI